MSTKSFYHIGGLFAFVGLLITVIDVLTTGVTSPNEIPLRSQWLNSVAALGIIPPVYALYQLYREHAPALSKTALLAGVLAAIVYVICMLVLQRQPLWLYNFAFMAVYYLPPLLFGLPAYHQPQLGMPRAWGVIGVVAGLTAIARYFVLTSAGGDWTNLPAPLAPVAFILYMTMVGLGVIWLVWTGILLLRRKEPAV